MAKAAAAIAIMVLVVACSGCASKHYADRSYSAVLGQGSTVPPDARQAVHELASLPGKFSITAQGERGKLETGRDGRLTCASVVKLPTTGA